MNYPSLAIEPRGFTQILYSEEYWASLPVGFISLYAKKRAELQRWTDRR